MKEEIERRRAEAAEKRQKVEDTMDGEGKPFKCVSPRGSSLKVSPPLLTSHLCPASNCRASIRFYLPIDCSLSSDPLVTAATPVKLSVFTRHICSLCDNKCMIYHLISYS